MRSRLSLLLVVVLAPAACSGDDDLARSDAGPSATDDGSVPSAPVIDGLLASYEVPVDPSLAPFAAYQVTDAVWRVRPGRVSLEYTLPAALVGQAQRVDVEGTEPVSGPYLLSGVAGTASCAPDGSIMVCTEQLPGIAVDVVAVESLVAAGALAPERLRVTRAFDSDPIGILRVEIPAQTAVDEIDD